MPGAFEGNNSALLCLVFSLRFWLASSVTFFCDTPHDRGESHSVKFN